MRNKTLGKMIVSFPLISALITIELAISFPANAQTRGEFAIHCMSRIMYSANRRRSEITESAANAACQNASTPEQSLAIGNCIKDTIYNSSGNIRDGMNATVAASVCQRAIDTTTSQEISKCMRNTMYDSRGRLRPGINADRAVSQCSRF